MNAIKTIPVVAFADFVAAQDPDESINHSNGWHSCAVGKYVEAQHTAIFDGLDDDGVEFTTCFDQTKEYKLPEKSVDDCMRAGIQCWGMADKGTLYELLSAAGKLDDINTVHYPVGTYGELDTLIKACTLSQADAA